MPKGVLMCGLAGLVRRDPGDPVDPWPVAAMAAVLRHRGPDDEGLYVDGPVALGHRRLSILDLSRRGRQPMANEDESVWLVFNGEIYNYLELRRDLSGRHAFRTNTDTEVLLHLYEELGTACLERLNGMFAFAIWDRRRQLLFAARDRLGIKPLYWHMGREGLSFASEPKALVAGGFVEPTVDPESLREYLTFQFCLGDRTLFDGVRKLEPGHFLLFRPGRDDAPRIERYWDFQYEIDGRNGEAHFVDRLLALLQDSVRLRLRSDVPLGAHLSGGIDTSTVVCLAADAHDGEFHTFTGAFREGEQFDETPYARAVVEHVGARGHEVWPTAQEFVDELPWLIYMMDEPAAGPGLFPQYAVSRLAREHVKVVLGGQGGDEIFGGYARYLIAYLEQCLKGVIYGTQDEGEYVVTWDTIEPHLPLLQEYRPLLQSFLRKGLFGSMDRRYFRLVSRQEDAAALVTREVWDPGSEERMFLKFRSLFERSGAPSYFTKMTDFDLRTLLPALLHVEDRTSMSVSLESRVPLLDHRIVELVTRMPPTMRFKGGDTKRVFRDAVRDLLPDVVYERRDKRGFPVPLGDWTGGPAREFVHDVLLGDRARQRGTYRTEGVRRLLEGERAFGRQLWGLLCLELWFRAFLDGDRSGLGSEERNAASAMLRRAETVPG